MIISDEMAINAERATLGSLLIDNAAWDEIGDSLQPSDFVLSLHSDIYRVIKELVCTGKRADSICVSEYLEKNNDIPPNEAFYAVTEIAAHSQGTPQNIKHYVEIIKQKSIDRKVISAAQDVLLSVKNQKDNSPDYAQQRFAEIADQGNSEIALAKDIVGGVLHSIDERQSNPEKIIGLPTGFCDLDKIIYGLHGGDLIILAGRPSMGKTLLSTNIAEHLAIVQKKSVIIFSLEMGKEQLIERSLSSINKIDAEQLRLGKLSNIEWEKISTTLPHFENAKFFIDDKSSSSVSEIRAKSRRIKREHGLSLVIVYYLTLVSGEGENETLRIGNISRGLKLLARDLNVPIIAISQLNRSVEQRADKRPCMADLRQSGAIEQDADLILFIYRDEVYYPNKNKGIAELIIAKHRNGNIGKINLSFNGKYCRFDNYSGTDLQPFCADSEPRLRKKFEY